MTTINDNIALVDAKLEEIFQRVEEESEKRAADGTRERRRGSVSITRFGQLAEEDDKSLSAIAAKSSLYHTPINNRSRSTLGSQLDEDDDEHNTVEEQHHVTQVHQIAPRASLSRAVGSLIARRAGRSRSGSVLSTHETSAVVIGVSVLETTQEHSSLLSLHGDDTESTPPTVTVAAVAAGSLRRKSSRPNLLGGKKGLIARAKSIGQRLRP